MDTGGVLMAPMMVRYNGRWYNALKKKVHVFGVRIKRTSPEPDSAVEYIDDAEGFEPMTRHSPGSWAGNPLIAGIKPVLRKANGTWQDLDKRDLSKGADLTRIGDDVMTEVPTWYLSISNRDGYDYIRFADQKLDSTFNDYASYFKGRRTGMFHIGCYDPAISSEKLYSISGMKPPIRDSAVTFDRLTACAHARAGFDIWGWDQFVYLMSLMVVLFKGRDMLNLIGKGLAYSDFGEWENVIENEHIFDNDYGMSGSQTNDETVSFFWITHFWDNGDKFIGGIRGGYDRAVELQKAGEPYDYNGTWESMANIVTHQSGGHVLDFYMKSSRASYVAESIDYNYGNHDYWCDSVYFEPGVFVATLVGGHTREYIEGPFGVDMQDSHDSMGGTRLIYREGRA